MNKIPFILIVLLTLGCSSGPENYIAHLNGYWEITSATMPNGAQREYSFSDTIDFLHINDSLVGYRKKLRPKLDGTFYGSDDIEKLKVVIENRNLNIYYETPYSKWTETVLNATEDLLIVENERKIRYTYKRYQPLEIH